MSVIYTCTETDECNHHYVLEHLLIMIGMCYLYPPRNFTCAAKLCIAIENENGTLDTPCASKKTTTTHVDIHISMKDDHQQESIKYACNFA